jgi:glycosyltransferase involved in cell wall biosynthesis
VGGRVGLLVQRACVAIPQQAFCFSELHARRLRELGLRGPLTVLRGQYVGSSEPAIAVEAEPLVVFAARLIPEKRVTLGVAAVARAAARIPGLRAVFYGDGPDRAALDEAIDQLDLKEIVSAPGFVDAAVVDADLRRALCMLLPSRREGYGLVVVEAAARATPSVVVAGEDNAATELVAEGVNGLIAPDSDVESLANALVQVHEAGIEMRESTAGWFAEHAEQLSLESSLRTVLASYAGDGRAAADAPPASARA